MALSAIRIYQALRAGQPPLWVLVAALLANKAPLIHQTLHEANGQIIEFLFLVCL